MTIDERPPSVEHRALREHDEEPAWVALARKTEAADRETRRREYEDQVACDSEEAWEAHWAGVWAARPGWMVVRYDTGPG